MKTKRSLVVIVSLITATLLLTACAQPEQSSLAGDWLLTPKDKNQRINGQHCGKYCTFPGVRQIAVVITYLIIPAAGSCQAGTKKNLLIFTICHHKKRAV